MKKLIPESRSPQNPGIRHKSIECLTGLIKQGRILVGILVALLGLLPTYHAAAQQQAVVFSTEATGVDKSIPLWGLDTAWLSEENVRRGAIFMGKPQVDVVRFSFTGDWPLVAGDLGSEAQAEFDYRMWIVDTYTDAHTALYLNNDTETADPSFINGAGVNAYTWAQLIKATELKCENAGRTVLTVAPLNEPDYSTWQGDVNRFGDVCWQLRWGDSSVNLNNWGIRLMGGNTLNNDAGVSWYGTLNGWGFLEEGNTHQLAGSFDNYAGLHQTIQSNGDTGTNDELHNVMEAMVGAEYGMDAGIWWGTAERARGEFVQASDGKRLGYAENRPNWTAASVYRAPNGAVKGFVGESERQALPTTYQFVSKDRPVFFDGYGPLHTFEVTTTGGAGYMTANHHNAEKVVNITWGDDVQPAIDGRYVLVNRNSGKVLTVPGGSGTLGVQLAQTSYTGATYQQWDVNPMPNTTGGDYSYFSINAAHSGYAADLNSGIAYNNGADIVQWNGGNNVFEQWYLEYVGDGYFKIHSRWCGKLLVVSGGSTAEGAPIIQWEDNGALDQQWKLIPASVGSIDSVAPPAPTGLVATANDVSVTLNWNAVGASDLAGYTVLRSATSGGPYEIIARGVVGTTFTDGYANTATPCYYVVRAEDESLNRSSNSNQAGATPTGAAALVAQYDFDGDVLDSSGNGNDAVNSLTVYGLGQAGSGSAELVGARYVQLPGSVANSSQITVAAWVYWQGGNAWQRIFDFGNGTSEYMFLTPSSGWGTLRFNIVGAAGDQALESTPIPTGQWVHVAVTLDGAMGKMYVNGTEVSSAGVTLKPSDISPVVNYIGKSQWNDPLFNGWVDGFRIYNYALSASAIATLANVTLPPSAPTGLGATAVSASQIDLSWTASTGATSYNVKRATTSGGPYTTVASGVTGTSFNDTGLTESTTYYYVVSAGNAGGESSNSAQASTTTQATPTPITPWIQIDYGAWQQGVSDATLTAGQTIVLGPQPLTGGTWSWSGPNGYSSTSREITLANVSVADGGTYVATFTNDGGAQSQQSFNITVNAATPDIYVANIAMSSAQAGGSRYAGVATITVKNNSGAVVPNATVSVSWSGAVSGSASGTTNGSGVVVFTSAYKKNGGTFTVTVTNVTASGANYNPALNVETSDSITAP